MVWSDFSLYSYQYIDVAAVVGDLFYELEKGLVYKHWLKRINDFHTPVQLLKIANIDNKYLSCDISGHSCNAEVCDP